MARGLEIGQPVRKRFDNCSDVSVAIGCQYHSRGDNFASIGVRHRVDGACHHAVTLVATKSQWVWKAGRACSSTSAAVNCQRSFNARALAIRLPRVSTAPLERPLLCTKVRAPYSKAIAPDL